MILRFSYVRRCWRLAVCIAAGTSGVGGEAAVTEPSGIFGFRRVTLAGAGTRSGVTMVGPSFVERDVAEVVLQAGAPKRFELVAVGVRWGTGIFGPLNGAVSTHYVEVKSSANHLAVGRTSEILGHSSNKLTIADDWSTLLKGGEKILIRPHKTVAGVFGAANETGLDAGEPTAADMISILEEGESASFTTYYYRSGSSLGGSGWRSSSDPFTDRGMMPLRTGQGLLVKRRGTEPLELVLHGFVKTGVVRRQLPTGYAIVDPLAPVTDQRDAQPVPGLAFTLGGTHNQEIIPSGLENALRVGTPQTADLVSLATTVASFYVASPNGLSSGGWRMTSNPVADQYQNVIPAASAMLFQIRGEPTIWTRPQPFIIQSPVPSSAIRSR